MKIYTVHEVSTQLKATLEAKFPFVWVRGELSEISRPSSGHIYLTLKDNLSLLRGVWFKSDQKNSEKFDPLTGEVFGENARPNLAATLKEGEEVLCAGSVTIYQPDGRLQLVVNHIHRVGAGLLQQQFEELKAKLFKIGYFSTERKRPLPRNPQKIAVITSPTGDVIHDFLTLAANRGTGSKIYLYPSAVQGASAQNELAECIKLANTHALAEAIVLIRGGGSLEDLWPFNTEEVATAIFNSHLPVVTGIGHEPDISIADLVADARASTPSHVPQLLWESKNTIAQRVDDLALSLQSIMGKKIRTLAEKVKNSEQSLNYLSPLRRFQQKTNNLLHIAQTLQKLWSSQQKKLASQIASKDYFLRKTLSEEKIAAKTDSLLSSAGKLHFLATNNLRRKEALLPQTLYFTSLLKQTIMRHESSLPLPSFLHNLALRGLERAFAKTKLLEERLRSLNPEGPLAKGYALISDQNGAILTSAKNLKQGDQITINMHQNVINATVNKVLNKK